MSKLNWGGIGVSSLLIAVLTGHLASAATGSAVALAPQTAARSAPITISGSGFGTKDNGYVSIAGQRSWTTTWTDTRVVAYVPERAPLGQDAVKIVTHGH